MLAHENVDGALHCLPACVCMVYVYVRVLAWYNVHCAYGCTPTHACECDCMCTIVCSKVFELCCMCRRGLTRIVRAMCVSAHAYTAAHVYVCACVRACLLMET